MTLGQFFVIYAGICLVSMVTGFILLRKDLEREYGIGQKTRDHVQRELCDPLPEDPQANGVLPDSAESDPGGR